MKWSVAAPFIDVENITTTDPWLVPYVPGNNHELTIIPRPEPLPKWHTRKSKYTSVREWSVYMRHASSALNASTEGIITAYPQLPAAIGLQQALRFRKKPVIAWIFNVGTCSTGLRRKLAQFSLKDVNYFIVHTRREVNIYSQWLGLPKSRFEFVPYTGSEIPIEYHEDTENPFITSLGSAHRDFPTFFEAVKRLNLKTVVATSESAVQGVAVPEQVELPFGISRDDCLRLAQQARLSVLPLLPKKDVTAAGQVTIIDAMMMGRPLILTNLYGADDYVIHGETGWLVKPNCVDSMTEAIDTLWHDHDLRRRISHNARAYALEHFSFSASGRQLGQVLDRFSF
ncbi:glycosyltransferase [Leptolyngbya sp. BL0902]|uniref:glycosyltransferase family 4 protein n=1 Tax=Leptolyngbya sp. BL0902 TaxID=1115757 RepID=UPI0018E706A8|nr:glycosyltransferase family 4 protein [Leptolyngbya sp. BL0902]QQE66172.1 glycosyltransferase [Leptolyngbya sp. BL0902]